MASKASLDFGHIVEQTLVEGCKGRTAPGPPRESACGGRTRDGHFPAVPKDSSPPDTPVVVVENDELLEARRQIRQMTDTVGALRTQLEQAEALRRESVQAAVAGAQDEIRQLQHTVASLRDELQALAAAKTEAVQAAVAAGQDEARQLHATIQALRDEMERQAQAHMREHEGLQRTAHDEIRQLRDGIAALRTELEARHARG